MRYDPKEFEQYPDIMNKEQLYKACHISKRTALYLLQSGLIPNVYSGKRTRCYRVRKSDVIAFIEDREVNPNKYIVPNNWYGSGKITYNIRILPGKGITPERMRGFYETELKKEPDVLTVADIVRITGYRRTTVAGWVSKGRLQGFLLGNKFRIPKTYLIDFLSGTWYNALVRKTDKHVFALWRMAGK